MSRIALICLIICASLLLVAVVMMSLVQQYHNQTPALPFGCRVVDEIESGPPILVESSGLSVIIGSDPKLLRIGVCSDAIIIESDDNGVVIYHIKYSQEEPAVFVGNSLDKLKEVWESDGRDWLGIQWIVIARYQE